MRNLLLLIRTNDDRKKSPERCFGGFFKYTQFGPQFHLTIQNRLTVADGSVKEGNGQLKQLLTQKNCTKKDLQRAQSKIEMGLKRRAELEEDQEVLKKKLKEIHEK